MPKSYKATITQPSGGHTVIHDTLERLAAFYQLDPDHILWAIEEAGVCETEHDGKPVVIEEC